MVQYVYKKNYNFGKTNTILGNKPKFVNLGKYFFFLIWFLP